MLAYKPCRQAEMRPEQFAAPRCKAARASTRAACSAPSRDCPAAR
jgi:hypothetical protein